MTLRVHLFIAAVKEELLTVKTESNINNILYFKDLILII